MSESVLIVAFDGMDLERIQEYGLEHVTLEHFGQIDNHTGVKEIKTGELFASFITGVTHEEHGVTGVKGWDSRVMNWLERVLPKRKPFYSWAATVKDMLQCLLGADRTPYDRSKLGHDTFFDTVAGSRAVNVPAYDVNAGIEVFSWVLDRYGIEHAAREAEKEHGKRREEFWAAFDDEPELLMAHFHLIDSMNHLFGDALEDEERLKEAYERMDRFAGDILEKAEGMYDVVLFMSDHGMPTPTAHNENAFYACTRALPVEEPHITDFRGFIEDWCGSEEDELAGVDI